NWWWCSTSTVSCRAMTASCWSARWAERRRYCVADRAIEELQSRCRILEARLNADNANAELDSLKADIGALFKTVEHQIGELTAVREDVLKLVEKWKAVRAAQPAQRVVVAPEFPGA